MNCISPPGPADRQLLAYLDDEADPETVFHLRECSYCRERAETLANVQDVLAFRLYRITCPSPTELGEFHLRLLPPSRMLVISQHLRECPHCGREIDELKEFVSDLAPGPGGSLMQQTKVLIAHLTGGRGGVNATGEMPFALRGEGKGPITFEVDDLLIVLDIQPATEGNLTILGQVAAANQDQWTDALVRWHQDHLADLSTRLDDLGAFRCEGVLPGTMELQIVARDGTVVTVPSFEVSI